MYMTCTTSLIIVIIDVSSSSSSQTIGSATGMLGVLKHIPYF